MENVIGGLLLISPLILAFVSIGIAKKKGRSQGGWFLITLLFVPGILILLALPSLIHNCPKCAAIYKAGQKICSQCGVNLPDSFIADYRLSDKKRYPLICTICGTPYDPKDYRSDVEKIYCVSCKAELFWRKWPK